ncbi:MAG: hypothetical protein K0U62_11565 [Actinomycetia bacterium]|nr:hypothetical protein [Actinomycetes bacterium]
MTRHAMITAEGENRIRLVLKTENLMTDKKNTKTVWLTPEAQTALKAEAERRGVTQGDLLAALIRENCADAFAKLHARGVR